MHLILAVESTDKGHSRFKDWLQTNFKQINPQTGTPTTPVPREIRFYNIVTRKEVVQNLVNQLSPWEKIELLSGRSFSKFMRFLCSVLPFDLISPSVSYVEGEKDTIRRNKWDMNNMGGPLYIQFVGTLPDLQNENGEDML